MIRFADCHRIRDVEVTPNCGVIAEIISRASNRRRFLRDRRELSYADVSVSVDVINSPAYPGIPRVLVLIPRIINAGWVGRGERWKSISAERRACVWKAEVKLTPYTIAAVFFFFFNRTASRGRSRNGTDRGGERYWHGMNLREEDAIDMSPSFFISIRRITHSWISGFIKLSDSVSSDNICIFCYWIKYYFIIPCFCKNP